TDVLGAGTHRLIALRERARSLLRAVEEFLESLACLLETGLGHRAHLFGNLETDVFAHLAAPCSVLPPTLRFERCIPMTQRCRQLQHTNASAPLRFCAV